MNSTYCRGLNIYGEVCCALFENFEPIGGSNETTEIDKSLLWGKRKYIKGRILLKDRWGEMISKNSYFDSDSDQENNNRNYGQFVVNCVPWVFRLCCRKNCYDRDTLIPIIQNKVLPRKKNSIRWMGNI